MGFEALLRLALAMLGIAVLGTVLAARAGAATTPDSKTNCGGIVTPARPTFDDPNLVGYKFQCDWGITGYTLIVNRGTGFNDSTIDDFGSSPGVFDASANPISVNVSCSGAIPGNGVNCNAGGSYIGAPNFVEGTFDTSDPFCAHIPPGSPPGTLPEPEATVELVVSDTTGAEDGPFLLPYGAHCPAVKVVKPKPKAKGKKHGKKAARKRSARKAAAGG